MRRWLSSVGLVLALLLAAWVRWPLLASQGLWVDEVFSLAIATGHSVEHPAGEADPARGDFVQASTPRAARDWRAFLEHTDPPAPASAVVRAVRLSDTSPPLYYLLLWGWTRWLGTSDAALRGFSLACALACLPLLARLARRSGGRAAVLPSCVLFALAPLAVHYGTEGRMYALLWLWTLAFARLSQLLRRRAWAPGVLAAWSAVAAAGFLTHYFFVFVWTALTALLFARPGRLARRTLLIGVGASALLVSPWYVDLAAGLGRWRITQDWLTRPPLGFDRPGAALDLFLGFFSGSAPDQWVEQRLARAAALALCAGLALVLLVRRWRRGADPRLAWAWPWLLAGWAGPLVFDACMGTFTVAVPRYALAGLPAALLLVAAALGSLARGPRTLLLGALCLAWLPHLARMRERPSRSWCPLREAARALEADTDASSLVVVHSIPTGLLGVTRYYRGEAPLAAWVEQLGERRVPASLLALAGARRSIRLLRVHEVGATCGLEDWLRTNAAQGVEQRLAGARLLRFELGPRTEF